MVPCVSTEVFFITRPRLLGKSILVSRSVMSLFCSRCSFGDGIAHLVEGLELNAILLELDLSENTLTKKGLKALVAVINSNKTLGSLVFLCFSFIFCFTSW